MKEWKCIQVGHHKNVAEAIEEYQKEGWRLHTYQATGQATLVSHYLLLRALAGLFVLNILHKENQRYLVRHTNLINAEFMRKKEIECARATI